MSSSRSATVPSAGAQEPLVTVGIPAYNRPVLLRRAMESVLAQSHRHLELLVSDDASTDPGVTALAGALASEDPRVRVVRQPANLGHDGNYQWVLEHARGEYFMWLSDDDWLDAEYVARCLAELRADPRLRLVCGLARYEDGSLERPLDLGSRRAGVRILRYFTRVSVNGALFSLARRADWLEVGFPAEVGGDWLLVAAQAGRGAVRSLPDVHINRSFGGLGADAQALARSFGLEGGSARHHHVLVAIRVWRALAAGSPPMPSLGPVAGPLVATAAAASILVRFTGAHAARGLLGPLWPALEHAITVALRAGDRR